MNVEEMGRSGTGGDSLDAGMTLITDSVVVRRYRMLAETGRWAEAEPLIRDVLERHPDKAVNWFNLGVCLDGQERHEEAARAFWRAWELAPSPDPAETRPLTDASIYHACHNLLDMDSLEELYVLMADVCERQPDALGRIARTPEFSPIFHEEPFAALVRQAAS